MRVKSILSAVLVSGSLAVAPTLVSAQDQVSKYQVSKYNDSRPTGDDSTLAPRVPGVTEDMQEMSRSETMALEEALAANGYDPGRVDGIIDGQTRAAIEAFQRDHRLVATGIIDPNTGELLGIVVFESS